MPGADGSPSEMAALELRLEQTLEQTTELSAQAQAEAAALAQAQEAAQAQAQAAQPEPEPELELTLDSWLAHHKLDRYAAAIKEQGGDELQFLRDVTAAVRTPSPPFAASSF